MSHTFGQFLAEFRADFGGWSSNTWRGLSGMLRKLDEEFGDHPLESITTRQIERYLTRRRSIDGIATAHHQSLSGDAEDVVQDRLQLGLPGRKSSLNTTPPQMEMVCPVTWSDRSPHRNSTTLAQSSGVPSRRRRI